MHRAVLAIALLALLALAPPASATTVVAETPGPSASWGFVAFSTPDATVSRDPGVTVTENVRVATVVDNPAFPGGDTVLLSCTGTATGVVAGQIRHCFLRGLESGTVYPVGDGEPEGSSVDMKLGAKVAVPSEPYEACVQTRVLLRENSAFWDTPLTCRRPAL